MQRIRRADLRATSVDREDDDDGVHDAEAQSFLREKLNATLGGFSTASYDQITSSNNARAGGDEKAIQEPAEEEDEVEFRLFAATSASTKGPGDTTEARVETQRIQVRTPTPEYKEPGFVQPHRDSACYFTQARESDHTWKTQLASVAMTSSDIVSLSQQQWKGCALPWKVTIGYPTKEAANAARAFEAASKIPKKRSRKSKTLRIIIRKQAAVKKREEEDAKAKEADKEAYLRDKKTKKNRERQSKRRAKEKAKKMEDAPGGDDVEMADDQSVAAD